MQVINKRNRRYVAQTAIVFFLFYYMFRLFFEDESWGGVEVLLTSLISSFISFLFFLLLSKYGKLAWGGVFVVCIVVYALMLNCFVVGDVIGVGDVWETREDDGVNVVMNFFDKDSVQIIISSDYEIIGGYLLKGSRLKIYDKEGVQLFNWRVNFEESKMILIEENEQLVFYKKKG